MECVVVALLNFVVWRKRGMTVKRGVLRATCKKKKKNVVLTHFTVYEAALNYGLHFEQRHYMYVVFPF